MMALRPDLALIAENVARGSRVLDVGCGDGALMLALRQERGCDARGLEIAPMHLPLALDAMLLDGWALIAIFGATDTKNIGFIFERAASPEKMVEFDFPRFDLVIPAPLSEVKERFVVAYVEREAEDKCVYIQVPFAEWPEWATGCILNGRGQEP